MRDWYFTRTALREENGPGVFLWSHVRYLKLWVSVPRAAETEMVGFVYTRHMSYRSDPTASFSAEARRTFYEAHRSLALFMLLIVCAAPFAGLYVAGLFGVVVGVLVSAAAYVLVPSVWKWIGG